MESDLCPKATKTQKPLRVGRAAKRSMDAEAVSPSKERARVASPDTEKPAGGHVQRTGQQDSVVSPGFRKGRGTRDQIANIRWIIKKQESSRKTSISALLMDVRVGL